MKRLLLVIAPAIVWCWASPAEASGFGRFFQRAPARGVTVHRDAPRRDLIAEKMAKDPRVQAAKPAFEAALQAEVAKVNVANRKLLRRTNLGVAATVVSTVGVYYIASKFGFGPALAATAPLTIAPVAFAAKSETRAKDNYHGLWTKAHREGHKLGLEYAEVERLAAGLLHPVARDINRNLGVRVGRFFFLGSPQDAGITGIGR